MSVNREVGKTDDLRLQGLLTGGGAGGYMYNYGPSGAPSNMPPTAFQQGLTRGPVSMTGMSDAQMQSLIDQRLDARALDMNEGIDAPERTGASRLEDTTGIWEEIFTGMGRSDLLETDSEILQILAETTTAGQPAALPDDARLTGLSQENRAALLQAILIYNQQLEEQQEEEVVDPNQSTIPADTTASEGDTTTTQEEEESGGIWGTIRDWWNSVSTGGTSGGGAMPFPGPGAGVEIDIEDIFTPGNWRVFLPGVIPGLPQSNTIIGTIQDILEDPSEVLGDLWNRIEEAADDPLGTLEGILNEAADSEGLITIGGIAGVVNEVIGRYGSPDESADEADSGLPLGGDEEEDRGSIVVRGESDPDAPVLGGAGGGASSGGSAGGGQVASRPSFDEFTPFMKRIQYQPVAVPKAIVPDAPIVSSLFEEFLK